MSNNISWSANANYEQLSDSHVKKESKTTKTKPDKKVYAGLVMLESVLTNLN